MMLRLPMTLLAAMASLALLWPCSIASADFAVHRRDSYSLTGDYPRLYDTTGNQIASLSLAGTASYPGGYYLQSLDYDATTGDVYGLVRNGSFGSYSARVLSWGPSGVLTADRTLNAYPTDNINYGMDIAVHDGVVAVHLRDTTSLTSSYNRLYSATTGNQIASLAYSGTVGSASSYYLQSLDFDATTGALFGLVRAASLGNTARVVSWSPDGTLLADIPLNGYPTDGTNYGMDMAVHDGVIAVHLRDTVGLTSDYARLYNATTGNPIAWLSLSGTAGNPSSYYLQSLDFDATTGNLFGLARAASLGSTARVLSWSPSGTLLSDVALNGYPTDGTNYGMDLAVFTAVPEPSSFALIGLGFATLAVFGRRSRRSSRRT